jgi:uncharacterized OB-fold protein
MRVTAHPDLFDAQPDRPTLRATRCLACGRIAFPPLSIGCDACGASETRLEPVTVEAAGAVYASATVHRHHGEPPAPYTVVEVRLHAGPIVRAMAAADIAAFTVGERVTARWSVVRADDDGNDVVEPVFEAAATGERS